MNAKQPKQPTPELLPCPFCGGEPWLYDNEDGPSNVMCDHCCCDGPLGNNQDAVSAWNRRAARTLTPEQVERARKAILHYDRHVYEKAALGGWSAVIELLREVVGNDISTI